jgi:aspartate/glutamate racemase
MVTVGLVGGLGPESTIDSYRRILEAWRQIDPSTSPSIVIDSLDVQVALRLVGSDRGAFAEYLLASLNRLQEAATTLIAPSGECQAYLPYGEEGVLVQSIDLGQATGLLASRYAPHRYEE